MRAIFLSMQKRAKLNRSLREVADEADGPFSFLLKIRFTTRSVRTLSKSISTHANCAASGKFRDRWRSDIRSHLMVLFTRGFIRPEFLFRTIPRPANIEITEKSVRKAGRNMSGRSLRATMAGFTADSVRNRHKSSPTIRKPAKAAD